MKRILTVLLALMLICTCLICCAAETEAAAQSAETTVTETVEEVKEEAATAETVSEETAEAATEETAEASAEEAAESEEEVKKTWFDTAFGKLKEVQWYTWAVLAILMVFGIAMCLVKGVNWTSRKLSYAAMCIAISFVLSLIRVYRMPQGGSITLISKLPLILFTMACGPVYGLVAGCAAGLIALIFDPYVIHPIQLLVDYPFASGAVALAYAAKFLPIRQDNVKLAAATVFGYLGSYIMAVLSGAIFFGEYAWEGYSAWGYSIVYNITYAGPECLLCVIIVLAVPGISRLVNQIAGKKL